jgi:hypothetical protein
MPKLSGHAAQTVRYGMGFLSRLPQPKLSEPQNATHRYRLLGATKLLLLQQWLRILE